MNFKWLLCSKHETSPGTCFHFRCWIVHYVWLAPVLDSSLLFKFFSMELCLYLLQGDSGGPLVVYRDNAWDLVGKFQSKTHSVYKVFTAIDRSIYYDNQFLNIHFIDTLYSPYCSLSLMLYVNCICFELWFCSGMTICLVCRGYVEHRSQMSTNNKIQAPAEHRRTEHYSVA